MDGLLYIPDREIEFELKDLEYQEFTIVGSRASEIIGIDEKYPVGKPMTIITSQMPGSLKAEINELIKSYCNH